MDTIEVRPFASARDFERVVDYFHNADAAFLNGMGADPSLLPERHEWLRTFTEDLQRDYPQKQAFYVTWILNGEAVGHSNINKIAFGAQANVHLHMWRSELRKAGLGTDFLKRSAQTFFDRFTLQRLICEPWAENTAPNRVLLKAGFRFVRTYRTVPGLIQPEQEVNRYELTPSDLL